MRLLRSGKADVNESHIGLAVHPLVNPRYLLITGAVVEPLDHVAE
jgi:hypothetical protein